MTIEEYWRTRCELAEKCMQESPCDNDITSGQIKAHAAYNEFLKDNPLGNYQVIGTAEMVANELEVLIANKGELYRPKKYARKIIATDDVWQEVPRTNSFK